MKELILAFCLVLLPLAASADTKQQQGTPAGAGAIATSSVADPFANLVHADFGLQLAGVANDCTLECGRTLDACVDAAKSESDRDQCSRQYGACLSSCKRKQ